MIVDWKNKFLTLECYKYFFMLYVPSFLGNI